MFKVYRFRGLGFTVIRKGSNTTTCAACIYRFKYPLTMMLMLFKARCTYVNLRQDQDCRYPCHWVHRFRGWGSRQIIAVVGPGPVLELNTSNKRPGLAMQLKSAANHIGYGLYYEYPHNKTQHIHSPIFRRRPIYTHQNGNRNPTSYAGIEIMGKQPV